MVRELRMAHQKIFGGADQALLLARVDTLGGTAESRATPIAHFDEDQTLVGEHDQIDLATATAMIAREALHAASDEPGFGATLPALARARR